ncbi:MAG TPA: DUF3631 domain-containing protein [Candidatus Angelobacter sp.]|nr:DUF3631 domain-containing protein [Candidatus Angelobacter sp.]
MTMTDLQDQDSLAAPLQGFDALQSFIRAFLIDDCQHSFGPSERQPIVALLNCGADVNARNLLRPFGIFSCEVKVEGASLKGYRMKDFQDAWERYAGPPATARDRAISVAGS